MEPANKFCYMIPFCHCRFVTSWISASFLFFVLRAISQYFDGIFYVKDMFVVPTSSRLVTIVLPFFHFCSEGVL